MLVAPCECCGCGTTGEIRYVPLAGGSYVLCQVCFWKNGNFGDMIRLRKKPGLPSYDDCLKKLKRGSVILHAVMPSSREEYDRLVAFWCRTHPDQVSERGG